MPNSQPALTALGNALFTGVETENWSPSQFVQAALAARNLGFDSLIVKVADGTNLWHGGLSGFTTIRNAVLQAGVGCLPYIYSYGDKYGALSQELDIIERYLNAIGLMCVDLEVEWNGQVMWARRLNARFANNPNFLYISCMANPGTQNQNGVMQIIAPSVNVWMPQVYSDLLQSVWHSQFSNIGITSGFNIAYNLDTSFGPNDTLRSVIANQGLSPTISIWEYQLATGARRSLCENCITAVRGEPAAPTTELANFPIVTQFDGDPNQGYNCVAGSVAAALEWLTKKPYTSGQVKDAVYGRFYQGNTAPENYIGYCAQQGVKLTPINGNGRELTKDIRDELAKQHPTLITEPDPYMPGTGETHVCVAYAYSPNSITVMDPFIAKPVTKTEEEWESQLQEHQIWALQKI